jgi:triphosphatase
MGRIETLSRILDDMRNPPEGSRPQPDAGTGGSAGLADRRSAALARTDARALASWTGAQQSPASEASEDGVSPAPIDGQLAVRRASLLRPPAEAQLRLSAEPGELAKLIAAAASVGQARNKGTVRLLKSVYYDTPSCALFRRGIVLRVRQSGKRFTQAVRLLAEAPGNPLGRREWETAVASLLPDYQALMPLMSMGLQEVLARDPLRPLFSIELRRHVRVFALPSGTVEAAFDQGNIIAGEMEAPIGDLGLRLEQGNAAALYELALPLSDRAAVRPSLAGKAQRGYDLVLQSVPTVHAQRQPLPSGDVSLDDALAAILQSALDHLVANQAAAADGRDAEGIHQLRIALRRLRCAFALLRPLARPATLDQLRADARWLLAGLGTARNWDVFLGQVLTEVAQGCGTIEGFDRLRDLAEKFRENGYVAARALLADRRAGRFQLALGAWIVRRGWRFDVAEDQQAALAEPAISFASRMLAKQHARVLKRGRHFKRLPLEARHDLRLAVKKLRYTADFFLPLFDGTGTAKRYARRLSQLQERLGRYNDVGTTRHLLTELAVDALPAAGRQALGAVLGWQACRLLGVESEVRSAWRGFRDAALPWTQND